MNWLRLYDMVQSMAEPRPRQEHDRWRSHKTGSSNICLFKLSADELFVFAHPQALSNFARGDTKLVECLSLHHLCRGASVHARANVGLLVASEDRF